MAPHPVSDTLPESPDVDGNPRRIIATKVPSRPSLHSRSASQGQHSDFAKSFLMNKTEKSEQERKFAASTDAPGAQLPSFSVQPVQPPSPPTSSSVGLGTASEQTLDTTKPFAKSLQAKRLSKDGVGPALSDTPLPSAPTSPKIPSLRHGSAASTPRMRPTTLDIPGLTKSKVSPDGRIAKRDVGSKLIIIMVGLPARGKSYITKKLARYLNWLQHDTQIFNVGERRRMAAHHVVGANVPDLTAAQVAAKVLMSPIDDTMDPMDVTRIIPALKLPNALSSDAVKNSIDEPNAAEAKPITEEMDQSADFFDPNNKLAAQIREQCAVDTLDDLLHYILEGNGAVGILDATNSTLTRRKLIMERIRERAGQINVLFVESVCEDEQLLETNMRLKLSGPDYRDKDPHASLEDFKKRVAIYEKNYVPIGEYEETNNMPYVKMIDVGRKVISHQIKGFLSAQAVYYLLNFNLAPRQIWITRHGESTDNVCGKIGGDSELSSNGHHYAAALAKFIANKRYEYDVYQHDKAAHSHLPPHPGDLTPPNPYVLPAGESASERNFCVWTSMLKRSIQSAAFFNDDDFDVKQMRMLDELYAGVMEGMTYAEIQEKHADEYALRQKDKLSYRYPGPGGEGYLDVINRLRPVIVELERMTDHALIVTHRSVARVLLAYFKGLRRDEVADLDCPLGMLYSLEPKPYGVEFKAYRYNSMTKGFDYLPNFELHRQHGHH